MIVTINTDAAFHHKEKIGAYAFWAVSNEFKIMKNGVFRKKTDRADMAEFQCIINAIHCVMQEGKLITKIIVNTDCLNVIHVINNEKWQIKKYRLNCLKSYLPRYKKLIGSIPVEFRHVKAHTHTDTARNWVNDWCDKKAKESLWKSINTKNKIL